MDDFLDDFWKGVTEWRYDFAKFWMSVQGVQPAVHTLAQQRLWKICSFVWVRSTSKRWGDLALIWRLAECRGGDVGFGRAAAVAKARSQVFFYILL